MALIVCALLLIRNAVPARAAAAMRALATALAAGLCSTPAKFRTVTARWRRFVGCCCAVMASSSASFSLAKVFFQGGARFSSPYEGWKIAVKFAVAALRSEEHTSEL